jgi:hypothetical protein
MEGDKLHEIELYKEVIPLQKKTEKSHHYMH